MNLTLVMPVEAVNRVIQALGKLPYDESAPVIGMIMQQANQQIAEAQAAQQAQAEPEPEPAAE
jgi:hydrogenase maturation factor